MPTKWTCRRQSRARRRPATPPPRLESLERRVAPAVFTVTNANNAGAGSLRDAITQANATAAADTIAFDPAFFNAANPRAVSLLTALPNITQDLAIVGPGANALTVRRDPGVSAEFRVFTLDIPARV